jgi:hypothetical protein
MPNKETYYLPFNIKTDIYSLMLHIGGQARLAKAIGVSEKMLKKALIARYTEEQFYVLQSKILGYKAKLSKKGELKQVKKYAKQLSKLTAGNQRQLIVKRRYYDFTEKKVKSVNLQTVREAFLRRKNAKADNQQLQEFINNLYT